MEELLVKYFTGEASAEETAEVRSWRSASADNAQAYLEYKEVWVESAPIEGPDSSLLASILADPAEQAVRVIPIWHQKSFQLAASILVVLGVLFSIYRLTADHQPFGEIVAEVTDFQLPDGSVVSVQRGGSLALGEFTETRREVSLTGKGFFTVQHDENRPFIVDTKNVTVRVLGTSFLVNDMESEGTTEVTVETGEVSMAQKPASFGAQAMEIRLKNGEMGIISLSEKGIQKRKNKDDNFLSWKTGVVTFKRAKLSEVSRVMEDMYGIAFKFENQAVANCQLTAKINNKSPEEAARIIAETFDFTFVKVDAGILFSGNACN